MAIGLEIKFTSGGIKQGYPGGVVHCGSVGVGLGKNPNPSAFVFNGTGGTAVVYHDSSDYGNLMALRGQTLQQWSADYLPGPPVQAAAFHTRARPGNHRPSSVAGCTSVQFSKVQILDVQHVGGAVEVTLRYGAVQKQFPGAVGYKDGEDGVNLTGYKDGEDGVNLVGYKDGEDGVNGR